MPTKSKQQFNDIYRDKTDNFIISGNIIYQNVGTQKSKKTCFSNYDNLKQYKNTELQYNPNKTITLLYANV